MIQYVDIQGSLHGISIELRVNVVSVVCSQQDFSNPELKMMMLEFLQEFTEHPIYFSSSPDLF